MKAPPLKHVPVAPPPVKVPRVEKRTEPVSLPRVRERITSRLQKFQHIPFQPYLHRHNPQSLRNFISIAAEALLAQHMPQPTNFINHMYNEETGKKETIRSLLNGKDTKIWTKSTSNEWGRLARGNDAGVKYTDTIDFINK